MSAAWEVHVSGPDDVLPADNKFDAMVKAHRINAEMIDSGITAYADPLFPLVWATPRKVPTACLLCGRTDSQTDRFHVCPPEPTPVQAEALGRALREHINSRPAPPDPEVERFAQDAADVQTKWLAEEMRANAAEDDLGALRDRLDAMAGRLEAEPFIGETSTRIAGELRALIVIPTAGSKVDTAPEECAAEHEWWDPEHDRPADAYTPPECVRCRRCKQGYTMHTFMVGTCPADTAPESGEGR